jgi:hypothetical protein
MMAQIQETCLDLTRRADVRSRGSNGIDYIDVSEDKPTLTVYFLRRASQELERGNILIEAGSQARKIRVLEVRLCSTDDPEQDDSMLVLLDKRGDHGTYTLRIVETDKEGNPTTTPLAGFDPRFSQLNFRFDAAAISDIDCKRQQVCVAPRVPGPDINYLAKDYSSFLQLIYDRLAVIMPQWQEQHEPDEGVALVEILAYVADYLSYYQDAVATEAYLSTARQRISVRRHVRLLDYPMHEGCNARAWLTLSTSEKVEGQDPANVNFIAVYEGAVASGTSLLDFGKTAVLGSYLIFEPTATESIDLYKAHNAIQFYTWGNQQCCLPLGSTSATLLDGWEAAPAPVQPPAEKTKAVRGKKTSASAAAPAAADPAKAAASQTRSLHLKPGDVLLLKEIVGPGTGSADDADPTHQQFVRLTKVTPASDSLYDPPKPVVEVEWEPGDGLTFPLCLSTIGPASSGCQLLTKVSIACGNVIMVDQGSWISGENLGTVPLAIAPAKCARVNHPADVQISAGPFQPTLGNANVTFRQPPNAALSASDFLNQDPRLALPQIELKSILPLPDGSGPLFSPAEYLNPQQLATRIANPSDDASRWLVERLSRQTISLLQGLDPNQPMTPALAQALAQEMQPLIRNWTPQLDLFSSQAEDCHYVAEVDDLGVAHLRFGDGQLGRAVEAGETFFADYRVGNGPAGNIGAGTIKQFVFVNETVVGLGISVSNPLASQGGTAPESVDEVKLFAPGTFLTTLERAVTADDYATIAERNPKVQRAAATLLWTGTGYEAHVAIDPLGTETVDENLIEEIQEYLYRFRRIGHDLRVVPAQYVPLDMAMTVEVLPDYISGHVRSALLDAFSDKVLADGSLGFFHPDNLSFGDSIYVSQLVAAAQSVTGVASVTVTRLQRLYAGPDHELEQGLLAIGPLEVAQLDNDPEAPERGKLVLALRGGL